MWCPSDHIGRRSRRRGTCAPGDRRHASRSRAACQSTAGAVDWRTTSVGLTITSCVSAPGVSCSIMSKTMLAAMVPISTPDWLTVVSGGIVKAAMSMSSKPTMESCSGIAMPAWNAACMRPMAMVSEAAKMAVGRDSRSKWPSSSRPSR